MEKTTWIPRNLNEKDIFKLGFGIKLKTSDLPFLGLGGFLGNLLIKSSYLSTFVAGPYGTIFKVGIITMGITIAYIFIKIKVHEYEIPTLLINSAIYTNHKGNYYLQKRKGVKK